MKDKILGNGLEFAGNWSAVEPAYSRHMECYDCMVYWVGCWDNFQCPRCGQGYLPSCEMKLPKINLSDR